MSNTSNNLNQLIEDNTIFNKVYIVVNDEFEFYDKLIYINYYFILLENKDSIGFERIIKLINKRETHAKVKSLKGFINGEFNKTYYYYVNNNLNMFLFMEGDKEEFLNEIHYLKTKLKQFGQFTN